MCYIIALISHVKLGPLCGENHLAASAYHFFFLGGRRKELAFCISRRDREAFLLAWATSILLLLSFSPADSGSHTWSELLENVEMAKYFANCLISGIKGIEYRNSTEYIIKIKPKPNFWFIEEIWQERKTLRILKHDKEKSP